MLPDIVYRVFFLAQSSESSDVTDLASQISGLLIAMCVLGLVWMGLVAIIIQRANERRRRAAQGLEPLPGIHIQVARWVNRQFAPAEATPTPAAAKTSQAAAPPPDQPRVLMPRPDLDQLVTVPTPDLADLLAPSSAPQNDLPWQDEPQPEPDPAAWDEETAGDADYADSVYDEAIDGEYVDEPAAETGAGSADDYADHSAGEPAVMAAPYAGGAEPADSVELLRVWRDLSSGALIVEIGGQRFGSVAELRGANLERRFQGVMRDLRTLADTAPPVPRAVRPQSNVEIQGSPNEGDEDSEELSLSPGSMLKQMTRVAMGQRPEVVEVEEPKSIAEEIETLLQQRLSKLPEFRQRSIHVQPAPDGGVQIEVDGTLYDGIGDIEDDAVRALLGDAVSEWEKRQ